MLATVLPRKYLALKSSLNGNFCFVVEALRDLKHTALCKCIPARELRLNPQLIGFITLFNNLSFECVQKLEPCESGNTFPVKLKSEMIFLTRFIAEICCPESLKFLWLKLKSVSSIFGELKPHWSSVSNRNLSRYRAPAGLNKNWVSLWLKYFPAWKSEKFPDQGSTAEDWRLA